MLVNGAVIQNGDRRGRLSILTPNAHILRLKDALHPEEAGTPVRRVCYIAQLVLSGDAEPDAARLQLLRGIEQLSQVFTDADSRTQLAAATACVADDKFYPALKALRALIAREDRLFAAAAVRPPGGPPDPAKAARSRAAAGRAPRHELCPGAAALGYAGWRVLQTTLDRQQAAHAQTPQIARETAAFRDRIGDVTSRRSGRGSRLAQGRAGAFGLQDDLANSYFVQKVLEDGTLAPDALANRLTDTRYRDMARAFGFGDVDPAQHRC